MDVLLLTKGGEQEDEGMKNFGLNIERHLNRSPKFNVGKFDTTNPLSRSNIEEIINLRPDIIHLIPGPTSRGLLFLRFLSSVTGAKSVATCIHPDVRFAPKIIAPDLMYIQSKRHREYFESKCETKFLPSGVDTTTFHSSEEGVEQVREEFGLVDRPIFLHVGHVKSGRNVEALTSLTEYGEVLIIGSPSTNPEEEVIQYLERSGCTVSTDYIPDISKVYNSADIYVFPVVDDAHSIQFPLSVLEAMACDLPVLSTPFGTLPEYFEEGQGLEFIEDVRSINRDTIDRVQETVRNRNRVEHLSWEKIVEDIVEDYNRL